MKNFLFAILISTLIWQFTFASSSDQQEPKDAFNDVKVGSTYYDAVSYLKNLGVISGYEDGSFKPDNEINRAEFTKILVVSSPNYSSADSCKDDFEKKYGYTQLFMDILAEDNAWYYKYICYAKINNWINGYPDGTFSPNQRINFAESAKILANVFGLNYSDNTIGHEWYYDYIKALESQNAIPLSIDTIVRSITRGEMAEMVYRIKSNKTDLPSQIYSNLKLSY